VIISVNRADKNLSLELVVQEEIESGLSSAGLLRAFNMVMGITQRG
jgi:hypothetical protein